MPSDDARLAAIEERRLNFEVEKHAFEKECHDRERWWHEDHLINQRTTWLLATQGILATAFGFVKYRVADMKYGPQTGPGDAGIYVSHYVETLNKLSDAVAAVGAVSSLVVLLGVGAAVWAQWSLAGQRPSIRLGIHVGTTVTGQVVGVATPLLCFAAWLFGYQMLK